MFDAFYGGDGQELTRNARAWASGEEAFVEHWCRIAEVPYTGGRGLGEDADDCDQAARANRQTNRAEDTDAGLTHLREVDGEAWAMVCWGRAWQGLDSPSTEATTAVFVDSRNLASWVHGEWEGKWERMSGGGRTKDIVGDIRDMFVDGMEGGGGGGRPLAGRWVSWIPRRLNSAADQLATWGAERSTDTWWIHGGIGNGGLGVWDLVVMSDAGIKADGRWGAGWLIADRGCRQVVAAGWFGGTAGDEDLDINGREAQALKRALEVTFAVREGRAAVVGLGDGGGEMTPCRRRRIGELLQSCLPNCT